MISEWLSEEWVIVLTGNDVLYHKLALCFLYCSDWSWLLLLIGHVNGKPHGARKCFFLLHSHYFSMLNGEQRNDIDWIGGNCSSFIFPLWTRLCLQSIQRNKMQLSHLSRPKLNHNRPNSCKNRECKFAIDVALVDLIFAERNMFWHCKRC